MAYPTYPTMPTYGNYIPPQAPTQSGMFYWVQSKQEAELYPVAPGNSVMFMDSNNMVIYITRDELNDILSAYMTKKPPKKESITNG